MIDESIPQTLLKNIILVGSTGAGKSSLGNYLVGRPHDGPFKVGDEEISCTYFANDHVSTALNARIIDTPGFGDNVHNEREIDKIIKSLAVIMADPAFDSTGQVEAFLMPVRFNPRPQTLKSDLEHFRDLFGTVAFKSLIILPIVDKPNVNMSCLMKSICQMTEIIRILREGKNEDVNESWFCLWDNLSPRPNQFDNLVSRLAETEPYTHKKFVEADQEIRARIDAKVKAEIERHIARIKREYEDDKQAQEQMIRQIQAQAAEEKRELLESRDRAIQETTRLVEQMMEMGEESRREMVEMHERMREEREKSNRAMMDAMNEMQTNKDNEIRRITEQNREMMTQMQERMMGLANRQPQVVVQRESRGCNIF